MPRQMPAVDVTGRACRLAHHRCPSSVSRSRLDHTSFERRLDLPAAFLERRQPFSDRVSRLVRGGCR